MAAAKPVVKISAMPAQMQADATIFAADGLNLFYEENDVAGYVKEQFEKKYRGLWHCFVGRNFGAFVTHEDGKFSYFYIGQIGFLIFGTV